MRRRERITRELYFCRDTNLKLFFIPYPAGEDWKCERGKEGRKGKRADQVVTAREDAHGGDHVRGEGSKVEAIDGSVTQFFKNEMLTISRFAVQLEEDLHMCDTEEGRRGTPPCKDKECNLSPRR